MKNKGLTLFETLIVITVFTGVALSFFYWFNEWSNKQKGMRFGNDVTSIISAFDGRMFIDGYDFSNFKNSTTWANGTAFINMLNTEFVAKEATCGLANGWVPKLDTEKNTALIPCKLWKDIPFNLNAQAKVIQDSTGFIKEFYTLFSFKSEADFSKNFKYINAAKLKMNAADGENRTGKHFYTYVNKNNLDESISTSACIALKTNCAIKASYSRQGGYEYLRVDGNNSMLGSEVTFREDKNKDRQQCTMWRQDPILMTWSSSQVSCGIGFYKATGYPLSISVNTDSSTQGKVLLNKLCKRYEYKDNLLSESASTSPCGMLTLDTGNIVYQITENLSANTGMVKTLYTSELFSDKINANYVDIMKNLTVRENAEIKKNLLVGQNLNVTGDTTLSRSLTVQGNQLNNGSVTVNGAQTNNSTLTTNSTLTANGVVNANSSVNVAGKTSTNQLAVNSNIIRLGSECFQPQTLQQYYEAWGGVNCTTRYIYIDGKSTTVQDCSTEMIGDRGFYIGNNNRLRATTWQNSDQLHNTISNYVGNGVRGGYGAGAYGERTITGEDSYRILSLVACPGGL